ncbi:MAG: DUF6488 family protein (plasmid) [Candidatus Manganitrophus sp.]|nr:DUF6488 family protein [Candidatus Manganitrophus sp.]MDC4228237.1 DUF6488 family protein [Candidatus Manganitrophus sp.]WDT73506.1 MAG: DUF6488 family protein [Candidatus Manganitrophus sp.]WDT77809.1 MAG: DUF6488 family protein [Candidatus Manganitrophus sp.]
MKKISIYFLALFMFSAPLVFAGPGSDHSHEPAAPISEKEALKSAEGFVDDIIKKGKLDASWADIKPAKVIQKKFKKDPEWVVTFENPKAADKQKQTLYVFMSLSGHYLGANFSGK